MSTEIIFTLGVFSLVALVIAAAAALKGWQGWLELKKMELAQAGHVPDATPTFTGGRIEMADLKERVRKLEAIAAGIEL